MYYIIQCVWHFLPREFLEYYFLNIYIWHLTIISLIERNISLKLLEIVCLNKIFIKSQCGFVCTAKQISHLVNYSK